MLRGEIKDKEWDDAELKEFMGLLLIDRCVELKFLKR